MKVSEEDYAIGASAEGGRAVFRRWNAFRGGGWDHLCRQRDFNEPLDCLKCAALTHEHGEEGEKP
jgi:hypothetical protein